MEDDEEYKHFLTSIKFSFSNADYEGTGEKGRLNAGIATVTPYDATFTKQLRNSRGVSDATGYYSVRYISGTLEVTKINVSIRVEPDRWIGNIYDGHSSFRTRLLCRSGHESV